MFRYTTDARCGKQLYGNIRRWRVLSISFDGLVKERRKEGNVLFNHALDTYYLRLYGVTPVVEHWLEREIA